MSRHLLYRYALCAFTVATASTVTSASIESLAQPTNRAGVSSSHAHFATIHSELNSYFDDFSTYPIGTVPHGWTQYGTSAVVPTVVNFGGTGPVFQRLEFPAYIAQSTNKWLIKDDFTWATATVSVKVNFQTSSDGAGLILAWVDSNNFVAVLPNPFWDEIVVWEFADGQIRSTKGTGRSAVSIQTNQDYWLKAVSRVAPTGDRQIEVWWSTDGSDYTLRLTATGLANLIGQAGIGTFQYLSHVLFDEFSITNDCVMPFYWQRDPQWAAYPLHTNGLCSSVYDTIGKGGCTLTSAAMLFTYFGANQTASGLEMNPKNLDDCMLTKACPFNWVVSSTCSNGKASTPRKYSFSWSRLDQELNQNHHPVILRMCMKRTCNTDSPITHWVVVFSGSGSDPANYLMNDPWFEGGASMRLDARSREYDFDALIVYNGQSPCSTFSTAPIHQGNAAPEPIQVSAQARTTTQFSPFHQGSSNLRNLSSISGQASVYSMTGLTMTVKAAAQSTTGNITEMLIWTDSMSNTTWQPFTTFVWLPVSDSVYVKFRDASANVSSDYSDTINPAGPPSEPDPTQIYAPMIRKN